MKSSTHWIEVKELHTKHEEFNAVDRTPSLESSTHWIEVKELHTKHEEFNALDSISPTYSVKREINKSHLKRTNQRSEEEREQINQNSISQCTGSQSAAVIVPAKYQRVVHAIRTSELVRI